MILMIVGILGMIWFLLPVFAHVIWNIGNITGVGVFLLIMLCGVFRKRLFTLIHLLWERLPGRALVIIVGAVVLMIMLLVIVESVCMIFAANRRPQKDDTVLVLGCQVKGERPSLMLQERLEAAYKYLSGNPDAVCILSGGQGSDERISEAECMYRYLEDKGIDSGRLYMEAQSTSTRENLLFSSRIIQEHGLNSRVAIVTNEFHEYRAGRIAKALGMEVSAVPAATEWWLFPTFYVRELYGILYEWFL